MSSLFYNVLFFLLISCYCFSLAKGAELYENEIKLSPKIYEESESLNSRFLNDNGRKRSGEVLTGSTNGAVGYVYGQVGIEKDPGVVHVGNEPQVEKKDFKTADNVYGGRQDSGYFNSNGSLFASNTGSGFGYHSEVNGGYPGNGYDFFTRLQDEVRGGLGDEIYGKMVWSYGEMKGVENWINSTVAQYGFGEGSLLGKQKFNIFGLDGRLNVLVVFRQNNAAGLFSDDVEKKYLKIDGEGGGAFSGERIYESKFAVLFEYFNVINIVYCFFIIILLAVAARLFKFFVRQQ